MPAGLIEQQHGVRAGGDVFGDFGEMQVHRIGVAFGQDERRALAVLGRDRAENIGRGGALILGRGRPRARFAQRLVSLFFWPTRASSANQIPMSRASTPFSRAISSKRAGKFF